MYRIFLVGLLLALVPFRAYAQSAPRPESVRSAALGGAVVALDQGEALDQNPASIKVDSSRNLVLAANFTPFVGGLTASQELVASALTYLPAISTSLFAGFSNYSYSDLYTAQRMALGLSRSFELFADHRASVGVRLHYASQSFHGAVPTIAAWPVDLGLQFNITPSLQFGASASKLLSAGYTLVDGSREELSKGFAAGFAYAPKNSGMTVSAEVQTEPGQSTRERFGAEYWIEHVIALRVGAASNPSTITGGVGLLYAGFALDAAAVYAPLGTSLTLGLGWAW